MKFEMTTDEFRSFCEQIQQSAQVHDLTIQLEDTRAERDSAFQDRDRAWRNVDRITSGNQELMSKNTLVSREISDLKRLVQNLQDQLTPFRKERKLSEIFSKLHTNEKIWAIKGVRELYNLGLKEAKDCVEGVTPKENTFTTPGLQTEISELTIIFKEFLEASPDVQRERLRPFVSVETSAEIASILNGNFQVPETL